VVTIRILALDQAKTTGYSVFDNGILVDYGKIELGKYKETYENILFPAKEKINKLIETTKADVVVIEDIQQQQNTLTYKKLAMLMGMLICLFKEIKIPFYIVPPVTWKAFAKIKGVRRTEQKKETIKFIKKKFSIKDITEDMADAISIGYWAIKNISENI
jgi:Holliday junction resolvasome RuvABC endonuclease subunit